MTEDKHLYIALDSCVLGALSYLEFGEEDLETKQKNDDTLAYFGGFMSTLNRAIKEDLIRLVILPTVNEECAIYDITHKGVVGKYIEQYGYVYNPALLNVYNNNGTIKELAYSYCSPYRKEGENVLHNPPMHLHYDANSGQQTPDNDAYIRAEATVCNVHLITMNNKHFNLPHIIVGVSEINNFMGFPDSPRSMTFNGFCALIKHVLDGRVSLKTLDLKTTSDSEFKKIINVKNNVRNETIKVYKPIERV